jgi:hypothetical protein
LALVDAFGITPVNELLQSVPPRTCSEAILVRVWVRRTKCPLYTPMPTLALVRLSADFVEKRRNCRLLGEEHTGC